jgi:hypothetical protein
MRQFVAHQLRHRETMVGPVVLNQKMVPLAATSSKPETADAELILRLYSLLSVIGRRFI